MIKSIISFILCFSFTMLINSTSLQAQQRQITPLSTEDYECLKELNCITQSAELREKGWVITFDETAKYPLPRTAQMHSEDLNLTAHYDIDGNLIRGIYELKNVALPRILLAHLAGEDFSGWKMTGNEIVVHDFNVATTKYHVALENEEDKKIVTFSHSDVLNLSSSKTETLAEITH